MRGNYFKTHIISYLMQVKRETMEREGKNISK